MKNRRRFRRPVLSRLALAWAFFAGLGTVFAGYAALYGEGAAGDAVALPVDAEIARFAPATAVDADRPALRAATPANLASAATPAGARLVGEASGPGAGDDPSETGDGAGDMAATDDVYAALPTLVSAAELGSGGATDGALAADAVVITVDGAPARAPGERLAPAADLPPPPGPPVAGPKRALLKKTAHGEVPRIGKGGERASRAYAKPFEGPQDSPLVAIVLGGLGLNAALTERAIDELPPTVTLAFAPYAKNLDFWIAKARADGHETVLELPMEPHGPGAEALGPAALLTSRTPAENLERLEWLLARFKGYFAVTNYLGGRFAADPDAMEPVLDRLAAAGVGYIDDTGAVALRRAPGEWVQTDRVISAGGGDDAASVRRDLEALERIAERDGDALGKAFAYDGAIDEIASRTKGLPERGLVAAPASAVLHGRAAAM